MTYCPNCGKELQDSVIKKGTREGILVTLVVVIAVLAVSNLFLYSQLNSVNTEYQSYKTSHSRTNSEYDALNTAYNNYKASHSYTNYQYDLLNDIVNLRESKILINRETINQPAGYYTYWTLTASNIPYAGYISVNVESSTTTNTYVRVVYSAYGVNFDQEITVGTSGTAVFPVLPSNNIQVRVGNTNWVNGATEIVTITYYY